MKYRATRATLVRAEPSADADDTGSIEKNIEFAGTPNPEGTWIRAEKPVVGWVDRNDCEEVLDAREPVQRDGFVQRCVIAEWAFNASEGIAPWVVVADYLIARATLKRASRIPARPMAPTPSARCAYRVPSGATSFRTAACSRQAICPHIGMIRSGRWKAPPSACIATSNGERAERGRRQDPGQRSHVPTLLEVFLAYLCDSPEAAPRHPGHACARPERAHRSSPPDRPGRAALLDSRARFFKAAGQPKSLRAVVAGARAILDAALEQAGARSSSTCRKPSRS